MRDALKKEQAYRQIKEKIVTCQYTPGMMLNEATLLEEIDSGRTPIREALSRLEQEQLIVILPKKGVMVADLTLKEICDVYHVRLLLEPHIIRTWGSQVPMDQLTAYRDRLSYFTEEMDLPARNALDDQLHKLIINSCPNGYLLHMSRHLYDQNQRIRITVGQLAHRMKQNISDHIVIADRLLEKDYEQAALEMHRHIDQSKQEILSYLSSYNI